MKLKWIVSVVFSVFCVVITSFWRVHEIADRQVIHIVGSEPLLVDSVKKSDQFVYYEVNGKSGMYMKKDVTAVGSVRVDKQTPLMEVIDKKKRRLVSGMGAFGNGLLAIDSRLLVFLLALLISFGTAKLVSKVAARIRDRRSQQPSTDPRKPMVENRGMAPQESHSASDIRDIVLFFMELYRLQNGLPKDTPSRFSITAESIKRKMKVYELGIKGSSDWLIRRMSIGPLGEDTGSKSKCYYVIYDTHMVVKIPPAPVNDMERYVKDIRREIQIAAQLAPIACIVPMVSVVFKKFKKIPFEESLTPEQLEKQYIRLIEDNAEYQEYLKIGDRFAFFMELSNSFFLGRVIDDLHESKEKIGNELREAPETAWNQAIFTTRYGLEALPVFESLQSLYRGCETEIRRIVRESGQREPVHSYMIKNWFLSAIADDDQWDAKGIDNDVLSRIKTALSEAFKANQTTLDALIRLLKAQMAFKAFSKSRHQIENIATNMLQLLSRLKEKRIALRDMKPDNLFLDADPDGYPMFLNEAEDFSIGVIDVETAISLAPARDGAIAQPLLGGTPLYATPLHVLKNDAISANFGNPADLLHYQDWFATIAIIFKAIAGRNLFPRAARSFPEILKILKSGRSKTDPDEATVKAMSTKFWSAAATDMKTSLFTAMEVLNQLHLRVPEPMVATIQEELEREEESLHRSIRRRVEGSALLKSEKNKSYLIGASSDEIHRQRTRWQNDADLPETHRKLAPQMATFLGQLIRLKQGAADKHQAIRDLSDPSRKICAYALLEAMFQIAFRKMYKSRWNAPLKSQGPPADQPPDEEDRNVVTAVLNDD